MTCGRESWLDGFSISEFDPSNLFAAALVDQARKHRKRAPEEERRIQDPTFRRREVVADEQRIHQPAVEILEPDGRVICRLDLTGWHIEEGHRNCAGGPGRRGCGNRRDEREDKKCDDRYGAGHPRDCCELSHISFRRAGNRAGKPDGHHFHSKKDAERGAARRCYRNRERIRDG